MVRKNSKVIHIKQGRLRGGSGKKSFRLVFWLFVGKIAFILLLLLLAVWLIYTVRSAGGDSGTAVYFNRGIGAGYSSDGKQLWIAAESGTYSYKKGTWEKKSDEAMAAGTGVVPVKGGYVQVSPGKTAAERKSLSGGSSGSIPGPEEASGGIWAAGFASHDLYQLKTDEKTPVLFSSSDVGKTWSHQTLAEVKGKVNQMAAHPNKAGVLALATTRGLLLTEDGGRHFETFLSGHNVSSVVYGFSDQPVLLAATFDKESALYDIIPESKKTINLDIATVEQDRIIQIARNPVSDQEAALLTKSGDVYRTTNGGQNWMILAKKGRGLAGK
ncbi:WD40 repeat domain-containing protein [Sporolactobacillus sp. THM7-7]|nr:WD40 repeat domain-containing protein [Sporolactobacillus sp. THM7-7]